jgi:hypothetical protein
LSRVWILWQGRKLRLIYDEQVLRIKVWSYIDKDKRLP